jgi:glycosyltransferase involved in cell wall biosynthesis
LLGASARKSHCYEKRKSEKLGLELVKILMGFHTLAFPPQSGVLRRTFHLLEETTKRHEVTIVSLGSSTDEAGIRQYFQGRCHGITYANYGAPKWINLLKRIKMTLLRRSLLQISVTRGMQDAFDKNFREREFDLIFLSSPTLLYYRMPGSIPCVTDAHNVEYDLWFRAYRSAKSFLSRAYFYDQYRLMKRDEIKLCRQPDVLVTTSERDKELFNVDLPQQRIHVIPNGVDTDYFVPQEAQEIPRSMVFSGVMNYLPNNQGMLYFLGYCRRSAVESIEGARERKCCGNRTGRRREDLYSQSTSLCDPFACRRRDALESAGGICHEKADRIYNVRM